jgi:hypothetical protein
VIGPGEILEGDAARRAWYQNCGIPRQLLRMWTKQRRRHDRTIRELETARATAT